MERIKLNGSFAADILRSSLLSVIFSIVAVIGFAFLFKALEFGDTGLRIGNEIIKLVSIFCGSFIGIKTLKRGILKGVCVGLLFLLFSVLIMKIFNGEMKEPVFTIVNLLLSLLFGASAGVFAVNFKRRT
ncbi:MAG: TIGR04086 family membrane protein [Clostridiales bacterium]|jgi:putative membrane protein (TIGR04086 family)|nr:TIGR04086 family membrane protein [Clostridiales bacterium]